MEKGRWRRDGDGRRGGNNCWEEWLRMRIDLVGRWRWWKVLDRKEGSHFKASVATAVKATETRLGAVKVRDAQGPAGGLVVVAQMVGEGWHWWTRQQGVGGQVWFREVRELRLKVRLWVMVRDERQMDRLWRMGDCRQGRRRWRRQM